MFSSTLTACVDQKEKQKKQDKFAYNVQRKVKQNKDKLYKYCGRSMKIHAVDLKQSTVIHVLHIIHFSEELRPESVQSPDVDMG